MSFQILNKDKQPITMHDLDAEAAQFWGKEVHPKQYTYPEIEPTSFKDAKERYAFYSSLTNWFDKIGWRIHSGTESWEQLRAELLEPFKEFPIDEIMEYLSVSGYIKLINHWESKGYQPIRVAE